MSNNNNINPETFISRNKIYIAIIVILLAVICKLNYKLIPISIAVLALIIMYAIWTSKKRKSELTAQLKDLTLNVNTTAKTTLINSPFPLAIIETDGNMIWKSEKFVMEFEMENSEILESLHTVLNKVNGQILKNDNKNKGSVKLTTIINNRTYDVLGSYVKTQKRNVKKEEVYITILYFIDKTEKEKMKQELIDKEISIGVIMIDNYEEFSQRMSAEARTILMAKIEQIIYDWANEYNAVIIKSERDTFYCLIENKYLLKAKEEKMIILDKVKEIKTQDSIVPTLSISFSNDGDTNIDKLISSKAVIDIALGRGGDQAIVKVDGRYEFFGGRSQEIEKRTKVKARMIAHALKKLMEESSNIIIMGHKHSDMDCFGSALGLYRLAKTLDKDCKIINETNSAGMEKFIEACKLSEVYDDYFISKDQALEMANPDTLLIVVDTNRKDYVESIELLDLEKIIVIDHHRRSTDYIENAILTFHEVYASSASELVTEILEYSQDDIKLSEIEVNALYAGIMLDTKNFTFKTGVRTFEAAAYLRKKGIDIIKVKKWFQSDLETYEKISEIVSKSEIIHDNIAVSIYDKEEVTANIIAAKAADELLTIGGISASFVLAKLDEKIYISGRSIGNINVQLILEKLGGGGHITLAGAQLEGISLEEAKEKLINGIDEYFTEMNV